jgi:hypothetical protein
MRKPSKNMGSAHRKRARKVTTAEKIHDTNRKVAPLVASQKVRKGRPLIDPFEQFRGTQIPDSMRGLAEKNIAQTRERYKRSKSALQDVLAGWEKGAMAFNREIMDMVDRNIDTGFDLATSFAGAKNLAEAMTSQAACWRRHFCDLNAQAEEVRKLAAKVTAEVAESIGGMVTLGMDESSARRMRSSQR